jgi:osmotically inducible lipoprotein OsmB
MMVHDVVLSDLFFIKYWEMMMSLSRKISVVAMMILIAGCSNLSTRQKNAAIGAGIGGVAGAVLTNGSAFGTVGGAAIGGVIGHGVDQLGGSKKK